MEGTNENDSQAILALLLPNMGKSQVVISANLQYTWPAATATTVASPPSQLGHYIVLNGIYAPRPANYSITWTDAGTAPSACTFNAQGSPDNVTWTNLDGGSAISCTSSGAEFVANSPVLYVRIYMASFTQGDSTTKVTFNYVGTPGGGSNACTSGSGCVLANGTKATTQSPGDNTTNVATDAFVLANVGSARWSVTTPTPTCSTGSGTLSSTLSVGTDGGKTRYISFVLTVTTISTCSGINEPLPFTPQTPAILTCRETALTGTMGQGLVQATSAQVSLFNYTNFNYSSSGDVIICSGVVQAQ